MKRYILKYDGTLWNEKDFKNHYNHYKNDTKETSWNYDKWFQWFTSEKTGLFHVLDNDEKWFSLLTIETQIELYNEWLIVNHLDEYALYPNDDEGIELCLERAFSSMCSTVDIANELTHSTHYDIGDRLVMHDRDILCGFKSLTDNEIEGYFRQRNFLDWLDGIKG